MRRLAEIKIGLRTQFAFTTGRNAPGPEQRHWLSYPVTKHNVADWRERGRGDLRLPNSLRFKIRPDPDGRLRGVIFHVPCLPPQQFHPDLRTIEGVWQRVHAFLDAPAQQLSRIPQ
jgi:CRISPR-associated protein Cmr1